MLQKLLLLFILLTTSTFAEEMIIDRTNRTITPNTIAPGTLQIETGVMLGMATIELPHTEVNKETLSFPSSLFRVGIFKFMELRLASSYSNTTFDFPTDDLEREYFSAYDVSLKFNIFDNDFDLGFVLGCELNNANIGGETHSANPYAIITASHSVTDNWYLGYNLGLLLTDVDPNHTELDYYLASVSSSFRINDEVGAFIELYTEIPEGKEVQLHYDNGLTYKLSETLKLDLSLGTCITDRYNFYSCGISWLIK